VLAIEPGLAPAKKDLDAVNGRQYVGNGMAFISCISSAVITVTFSATLVIDFRLLVAE